MTTEAGSFLEMIEAIDVPTLATENGFNDSWRRDAPEYGTRLASVRSRARKRNNDAYRMAVYEAARLIDRVRSGALPSFWLREAMSTSDFPLLFGDVLDRQMLGAYSATTSNWRQYMRVGTVPDFRKVSRFYVDGGESVLAAVPELGEYKAAKLSSGRYQLSVAKYGRRMPFSFETLINDDMDAIADVPARFARAATRSEARFATTLLATAAGPNSAVYSNANKNIVAIANGASLDNPVLGFVGIQAALDLLALQRDTEGEPIVIDAVTLVIPPELTVTAQQLLNATEIAITEGTREIRTANWLRGRLTVQVDPYLSIVNTTNGKTAWYLMASTGAGRPAFEVAFLRGYEQPQMFMRSPNAVRVGGAGLIDPMQGDFDNDSIDYKIRHMFGGAPLDPKATVVSKGTAVA